MICYIYTPSQEGEVDGTKRAENEKTLEPTRKALRSLIATGPGVLAPGSKCADQACGGSGRGAALPLPEKGARAEGLAAQLAGSSTEKA